MLLLLLLLQFERAAKEVLKEDHQLTSEGEEQEFEDVQVLLFSSQPFGPQGLRQISSARVSQLVQISGIITSASKPKVRAGAGLGGGCGQQGLAWLGKHQRQWCMHTSRLAVTACMQRRRRAAMRTVGVAAGPHALQ